MPTSRPKNETASAEVDEPMCEWVDRHTIRYMRELPHGVARVWRALTDADEIARWFIGPVEIDLRVGGAYRFGDHFSGTIRRLEPPRVVEFAGWRFELEPTEQGCRLTFTDWVAADEVMGGAPGDPDGGDQPFGPGTHWPGVLVGWHGFLRQLRRALDDPGGAYGWPLSEADQAAHDASAASGEATAFLDAYREHMKRSPVLTAT